MNCEFILQTEKCCMWFIHCIRAAMFGDQIIIGFDLIINQYTNICDCITAILNISKTILHS